MKTPDKSDHPSLKHEVEIVDRPPVDERTWSELPEVEVVESRQVDVEPVVEKTETTPIAEVVEGEEPSRRRMWSMLLPLMLVVLIGGAWWGWQEKWFYSGPQLILTQDGLTWTLDLNRVGYDGERSESIDRKRLRTWLKTVAREVDQPARDARMQRWGDPIEQSKPGKELDVATIEEKWLQQLESYVDRPQPIPMITVQPRVREDDLKAVGEKEWSVFTTQYHEENLPRSTNIAQSAAALDGRVINPGESFTFLEEVGREEQYETVMRTVDGTSYEIPAGGLSQTSSTLFNAIDQIDLEIMERYTFSNRDAYVAASRDAYVCWCGEKKDFRFRNTLDRPILIRAEAGGGYVTIRIFSDSNADLRLKEIPPAPVMVDADNDAFEPLPEDETDTAPADEDTTTSSPHPDNSKPSTGQDRPPSVPGESDGTSEEEQPGRPGNEGDGTEPANPPADPNPPTPAPEPGDDDDDNESETPPESPGDTTSPEDPEGEQQVDGEGDHRDEATIDE